MQVPFWLLFGCCTMNHPFKAAILARSPREKRSWRVYTPRDDLKEASFSMFFFLFFIFFFFFSGPQYLGVQMSEPQFELLESTQSIGWFLEVSPKVEIPKSI